MIMKLFAMHSSSIPLLVSCSVAPINSPILSQSVLRLKFVMVKINIYKAKKPKEIPPTLVAKKLQSIISIPKM